MRIAAVLLLLATVVVAENNILQAQSHDHFSSRLHRLVNSVGSVKKNAAKPVCVFIHGLGQKYTKTDVVDDLPDYWGTTKQAVAPSCTAKFITYESSSRAFNNTGLLDEICGAIIKSGARIVFTHSNGNLLVASAIKSRANSCSKLNFAKYAAGAKITSGQLAWVVLQAPFGTSSAAQACVTACGPNQGVGHAIEGGLTALGDLVTGHEQQAKSAAQNALLDAIGAVPLIKEFCGCANGKPSPAIGAFTTPSGKAEIFSDLQDVAFTYAWFMLCGISPNPAGPKIVDSTFMPILSLVIKGTVGYGANGATHEGAPITGNDGFVSFATCRSKHPDKDWQAVPTARLYYGPMNHGDGTGRSGNGNSADKKPLDFMSNAAKTLASLLQ